MQLEERLRKAKVGTFMFIKVPRRQYGSVRVDDPYSTYLGTFKSYDDSEEFPLIDLTDVMESFGQHSPIPVLDHVYDSERIETNSHTTVIIGKSEISKYLNKETDSTLVKLLDKIKWDWSDLR